MSPQPMLFGSRFRERALVGILSWILVGLLSSPNLLRLELFAKMANCIKLLDGQLMSALQRILLTSFKYV